MNARAHVRSFRASCQDLRGSLLRKVTEPDSDDLFKVRSAAAHGRPDSPMQLTGVHPRFFLPQSLDEMISIVQVGGRIRRRAAPQGRRLTFWRVVLTCAEQAQLGAPRGDRPQTSTKDDAGGQSQTPPRRVLHGSSRSLTVVLCSDAAECQFHSQRHEGCRPGVAIGQSTTRRESRDLCSSGSRASFSCLLSSPSKPRRRHPAAATSRNRRPIRRALLRQRLVCPAAIGRCGSRSTRHSPTRATVCGRLAGRRSNGWWRRSPFGRKPRRRRSTCRADRSISRIDRCGEGERTRRSDREYERRSINSPSYAGCNARDHDFRGAHAQLRAMAT